MITLGIYNLGTDPSAAIIKDGHVIAYNEEERLLRYKHADGLFPSRAIEQVLKQCNLSIGEIDNIAIPWDCSKYDDGRIEQHYEEINAKYNITHPNDIAYEKKKINQFKSSAFEKNVQKKHIVEALNSIHGDTIMEILRLKKPLAPAIIIG